MPTTHGYKLRNNLAVESREALWCLAQKFHFNDCVMLKIVLFLVSYDARCYMGYYSKSHLIYI